LPSNVNDEEILAADRDLPEPLLVLLHALPRDLSAEQRDALTNLIRVLAKEYPQQTHAAIFPGLIGQLYTLSKDIPPPLLGLLGRRDGPSILAAKLPLAYPAAAVVTKSVQEAWERVGNYYRSIGRRHEALSIYTALYDHMLLAQEQDATWHHKGMPLVWIRDCYQDIAHNLTVLRYLMLTLVEDAIRGQDTSRRTRQACIGDWCTVGAFPTNS
jgi:hypothetical protein